MFIHNNGMNDQRKCFQSFIHRNYDIPLSYIQHVKSFKPVTHIETHLLLTALREYIHSTIAH